MSLHLRTGKAMMMREELQGIYESCSDRKAVEKNLKKRTSRIIHSGISEMKDFAKLVRNHLEDILNYFEHQFTNAILEGTDSII